jgi:hypothetical protein
MQRHIELAYGPQRSRQFPDLLAGLSGLAPSQAGRKNRDRFPKPAGGYPGLVDANVFSGDGGRQVPAQRVGAAQK